MALEMLSLKLSDAADAGLAEALEHVAWEALADRFVEHVTVRFGTWCAESGSLQVVCKVEAAGDPFSPGWRWWSGLCDSPEDLRRELAGVVAAHGRPARVRVPAVVEPRTRAAVAVSA